MSSLARDTLSALLAPRRLVPILVVVCPLLALEVFYNGTWKGIVLGGAMCSAFVLLAPLLWRSFFPFPERSHAVPAALRCVTTSSSHESACFVCSAKSRASKKRARWRAVESCSR